MDDDSEVVEFFTKLFGPDVCDFESPPATIEGIREAFRLQKFYYDLEKAEGELHLCWN